MDGKRLKGASTDRMSLERRITRNMKREMNWKDELPQEICDFLMVKTMK